MPLDHEAEIIAVTFGILPGFQGTSNFAFQRKPRRDSAELGC